MVWLQRVQGLLVLNRTKTFLQWLFVLLSQSTVLFHLSPPMVVKEYVPSFPALATMTC